MKTTPYRKAQKILSRHYADILKRRGTPITQQEVVAEIKNILRKWDDAAFLENMAFAFNMEKEEWEAALKEIEK